MENLNLRFDLFLGLILVLFLYGSHAAVQPTLRPRPSTQLKPASDSNACHLPAVTGPCRANFQRYHFDSATGQCHIFTYGGCQGNANNFETLQQCQAFGSRCLRGGNKGGVPPAPLPTRRPMSDHKPLDLRWVGKYPVTTERSGRHHGGGSGRHPGVGGAGRLPGVGGGRQSGGGSGNRWNS